MKIIFTLLSLFFICFSSEATDTHPQLCENIRVQLSEDCSTEPNTLNKKTGAFIKRTYEECYEQDFSSTVQKVNDYLTNELGIYTFGVSYDDDQIVCDTGE